MFLNLPSSCLFSTWPITCLPFQLPSFGFGYVCALVFISQACMCPSPSAEVRTQSVVLVFAFHSVWGTVFCLLLCLSVHPQPSRGSVSASHHPQWQLSITDMPCWFAVGPRHSNSGAHQCVGDYPFSHSQAAWGFVALWWLYLIIFPWQLTFSFMQSTSRSCHPASVSVNNSGQGISLQLPNFDYSPYVSFMVKNTVTFYIYLWNMRNVFSILHFWSVSLSGYSF